MIESGTEVPNDLQSFLRAHGRITRVFFNGRKAEACFKRHVLGKIDFGSITYVGLPSTSPANASTSYEEKLQVWRTVVGTNPPMQRTVQQRRVAPLLPDR